MTPRVLSRLLQIQRVLVRHRLDGIIRATHLFRPLRFAFYLAPATWFRRASDATRGERLRLALEPRSTFAVQGDAVGQHLDGDVTIQLRVARAKHLAHAANADERHDLVRSNARSRREWHEVSGLYGLA